MNILIDLKESAFTDWLLVSILGFPTLIALHSVGMAIVVGLTMVVALRANGLLLDIDAKILSRLIAIAAWGFVLNLVTGIAIFITRGPEYITAAVFLIKMGLVAFGAVITFWLGSIIARRAGAGEDAFDDLTRGMSIAAASSWFGAVVAGRLIAYLSDLYR